MRTIIFAFFGVIVLGALTFLTVYVFPWEQIEWGTMTTSPERLITVTGSASKNERNQIARFSAGVSSVDDNKDKAIADVNKKVEDIIEAVKDFGIDDKDIQTQNMSIYQGEEMYYEEGRQKQRMGQWRVSNTIEVTLREVDKASRLTEILSSKGATNVYGPNFMVDDNKTADNELLVEAIEDARLKAEEVARGSGVSLGEVVAVVEGSGGNSIYYAREMMGMGGGGGAPLEPGSSQLTKTVTVSFRIR